MIQKTGVIYQGYPSEQELSKSPGVPSDERIKRGPVAFIECVQEIPCNPCEEACPYGAIAVGQPITNLPRLDEKKCVGCGACIAKCPGLAIFVLDGSEQKAKISFPHEYYPLPQKGDVVDCVDREGKAIVKGIVLKVVKSPKYDATAVVTVEVPMEYIKIIRSIKRPGRS
ncbi:MAG: 4Fe-4S binding protein [Tepidanaerobacteraceae bacterium]|jgi:Fe-S-cluster-containing hydrogenase component 2|nr:4Fe-4S binding protein [Tepidanaerobacteraceae bacterium]